MGSAKSTLEDIFIEPNQCYANFFICLFFKIGVYLHLAVNAQKKKKKKNKHTRHSILITQNSELFIVMWEFGGAVEKKLAW